MKPIENYEAEVALEGKTVYVLDRTTAELLVLNKVENPNFVSAAFLNGHYIYYADEN